MKRKKSHPKGRTSQREVSVTDLRQPSLPNEMDSITKLLAFALPSHGWYVS